MRKNNQIDRIALKYSDKISRSLVKNLPELVFVPFSRAEGTILLMKLPWKDRSGQIDISVSTQTQDVGIYTNDPDFDILKLDQMPNYQLNIDVRITSASIDFNCGYKLIFNPYDHRDIQIIKNIISGKYAIAFYDKNTKLCGGITNKESKSNNDIHVNEISTYPSNLKHIEDIVAFRRIYHSDSVVYYAGDFRSVRNKYFIDASGQHTIKIEFSDFQACCNLLYYNETFNFIGRLREEGLLELFSAKTSDLTSHIKFSNDCEFEQAEESFAQYISILDRYVASKKLATAISEMTSFAENNSSKSFVTEIVKYLCCSKMEVDASLLGKSDEYKLFAQLLHHWWLVLFITNCLSRNDGQFTFVTPNGEVLEYRIPEFTTLGEAYHHFEILAAHMISMSFTEGIESILDNAEAFASRDSFQGTPMIDNGINVSRSLLAEAVKDKTYTINNPVKVQIEQDGIESIHVYEPSEYMPVFKIRMLDKTICFMAIDAMSQYASFWSGISGEYSDVAQSIKCFCSAAYRDLSICETVVLERVRIASPKSTPNDSDQYQSRVVYLPRHRNVYLQPDSQNQNLSGDSIGRTKTQRAAHDVVQHLRKVKHSASKRQIELAWKSGIEVPEGYTFVRQHRRSGIEKDTIYRSKSALEVLIRSAELDSGSKDTD